ncbi:MAG: hypothetical protein JXJ20_04320 [Anaerolineae bacterium]|nr:hypothetical protein [Anaerolineae bacterium]
MWRKMWLCAAALAAVIVCFGSGTIHAQDGAGSLMVGDSERTYHLHVPPTTGDESVPLVIALHPAASSGRAMQILTGFDALADREGFIVVYPDSAGYAWDDARYAGNWPPDMEPGDDMAFLPALIDHLAETYPVDTGRVYLAGFGRGGTLAYRFACEQPEYFAKIATVGALTWDYQMQACPAESEAVPMLMLLGDRDAEYPAVGQMLPRWDDPGELYWLHSISETLAFWAGHNGCNLDESRTLDEHGITIYENCANDATTAFYTIEGAGHNWPRINDHTLNQFGIDASEVLWQFFSGGDWTALAEQRETDNDLFGGFARSYTLYVPPTYDPAEAAPLVVALHGKGGIGAGFAYYLDLNQTAQEHDFIAVYPDGAGNMWNYVRGSTQYEDSGIDDTAFLSALIDDLALDLNIDRQRVYVTGFSNGGFMVHRLACEASGVYAAFAPIGSTLATELMPMCEQARPLPILIMHGTADDNIMWGTVYHGDTPVSLSVPDTVLYWAVHNSCDPELTDYTILPQKGLSPDTSVYRYTFGGCADGSDVLFYAVEGGGHDLPGTADKYDPDEASGVNMDINTADVVWDFFEQYTLPDD